MEQLHAEPVPFPFELPIPHLPQLPVVAVEHGREVERVGLSGLASRRFGFEQSGEVPRGRTPVALEPMGHHRRGDARQVGERAHQRRTRHPDAQLARDELMPNEPLRRVQFRPRGAQEGALSEHGCVGQRLEAPLDELRQRRRRGVGIRRQEEGHRLGEVADMLVTVLDQPKGEIGGFRGQLAQDGGSYRAFQTPAGKKPHRPRGVRRRGLAAVGFQRCHLVRRARGAVEFG